MHDATQSRIILTNKYRKNESEKKLLQTEENLLRIKDLLSELESQVGPLEIQSKKARKYLDLREVLKGLDIKIKKGSFFALLGANGAGKTTSIGKIAAHLKSEGKKVLLVATGALMNTTMVNQKLTIPSIAHAISLEAVK